MRYFIITGASKGLGEGIALALLDEDHHLFCISRSENKDLKKLAVARNCKLDFHLFDLAVSMDIDSLAELIFTDIDKSKAEGVYLINNAGLIDPVKRVEDCSAEAVDMHMRVNLIAPMLLSSAFIKHTAGIRAEKRILNISSGAASNPYYGWSCYCTGKAGIEMFGRCITVEQEDEDYPVQTMSVAPGVIDTGMQETIRSTNERDFINREKFVDLKESGQLVPPGMAGKKLAGLLLSPKFRDGQAIDIRDSY